MFIIEGSDRLGKTTAIHKMRQMVGLWNPPILYSHMSRPNETLFDFYRDYRPLITPYTLQDRFHLGGIVWHDKITQVTLRRIESWLDFVASKTAIIYASDFRWYERWIKSDDRGNMLDDMAMMEANQEYALMANGTHSLHPKIDFSYDIKNKDMTEPCFIPVDILEGWTMLWHDDLYLYGKELGNE